MDATPAASSRVKNKWGRGECLQHGLDWFGDGSLWVLDAPGVQALSNE
jgi:hypothetical protein